MSRDLPQRRTRAAPARRLRPQYRRNRSVQVHRRAGELVPRRDGRSDDSTGSSAFHVQAGGLDGARVAWQSRDLCVAFCSGCCAHRTGRESARNGVTLNHNAIPISCSVAAGVPGFGALAAIFKLAVTTPMPRTSRQYDLTAHEEKTPMNVLLWVLQVPLALLYLSGGA